MLDKLFHFNSPDKILELENLEKILQASLPEIEPRSGYEANLRSRLSDYSRNVPMVYPKPRIRYTPTTNEALLMIIGLVSGAAVLAMGIRVAIITIAGVSLVRNMKRDVQSDRWRAPRPAG
jgi:hypothetical protein